MDIDKEVKQDEVELSNLQRAVSDVETAIAVSTPGTRGILENFVRNAKGQIGALEKRLKEVERQAEQHAERELALVAIAQKETALNAEEKEAYAGFLKKDFFTNHDFGRLEVFYAHSWDRLSERGKDEMSHRIWEGIRHEEYSFTGLPKSIREKETKHAYGRLQDSSIEGGSMGIPESDRHDFIRAYEAGERDEAGKILERRSFKEHMFRGAESSPKKSISVVADKEIASTAVETRIRGAEIIRSAEPSVGAMDLDLSAFKTVEMKEAKTPDEGSIASLPRKQPSVDRGC